MASPPDQDLLEARRRLAGLINDALERGQRGDGTSMRLWEPWSNVRFADKIVGAEAAVRTWRNMDNPGRPKNIIPLLKAFYGDIPKFAAAGKAMHDAWRLAGGFPVADPSPPPPRTIEATSFSEFAEIVDLEVSQPTPDNNGNLIVPVTLRIHPDTNCEHDGKKVEIGVTAPYVMVESRHWRPNPDSVFRGKKHPHIKGVGKSGAIQVVHPRDQLGRIDGAPLEDEPRVTMEPLGEGADGPITFSVRVAQDGFKVTPCDAAEVTDPQKAVLDAIFNNDSFPKDGKKRLIVASETVRPRATRDTI